MPPHTFEALHAAILDPMKRFPCAHATHPQWRMAAALVVAQLEAQMQAPDHADRPALGLLYASDAYAAEADDLLDFLADSLPSVRDWVGTVGVGVAASGVEYFDEPALAVMLCDLPPAQYRVFHGLAPLPASGRGRDGFEVQTALVHAGPDTPDLGELIGEMADRTASGFVFGGVTSGRGAAVQFARHLPGGGGVFHGGLSGVAFGPDVALLSRVTQGAQPVAPPRTVTQVDPPLVLTLDHEPALDVLLRERGLSLDRPHEAMPRLRATLVGLSEAPAPHGAGAPRETRLRQAFGTDVRVRHLVGLDLGRRGIAVSDRVAVGDRLSFCVRHPQAARADLVRVCTALREHLEQRANAREVGADDADPVTRQVRGAIYISCAGRGGPHFGAPSAELQVVRQALGDVPLVGFFAGGEIAHHHLYAYTGVLTVFTD